MQSKLGELHREASELYRLIEQVDRLVREYQATCAYPRETRELLRFVRNASVASKHFLDEYFAHKARPDMLGLASALKLSTLGDCWAHLHDFVKPIVDAHTLNVPTPLIGLLNKQLRELRGHEFGMIAVAVEAPLNYFHWKHTRLRELGNNLCLALTLPEKDVVPLEAFPRNLGLIGLPHSQGNGVFRNVLLYHELGHFVFEEKNLLESLRRPLENAVAVSLDGPGGYSQDVRDWIFEKVRPWCEEVFCDLFAVRMIGPAYTYVFAELFYLIGSLRDSEATLHTPSHPAPSLRLKEQIGLLKRLGWWNLTKERGEPLTADLERVAKERPPDKVRPYGKGCEQYPPECAGALRQVMPQIRSLVAKSADNGGGPDKCFRGQSREIARCLLHGIVPSVLFVGGQPRTSACLVTLLNAAYFFQLENLDGLFDLAKGYNKAHVAHRAMLRQRVEEWTLKAIEDLLDEHDGTHDQS